MLGTKKFTASLAFTAIATVSTCLYIQQYQYSSSEMTPNHAERLFEAEKEDRNAVFERFYQEAISEPRSKRLPDVIGIGVKKCGTGALVRFMQQHPLIKISPTGNPETFFLVSHYRRGLNYYKKLMPKVTRHELAMEKTPGYFYSVPTVPDRIQGGIPKAKLILSLCNPIQRAFSDLVHTVSRNPAKLNNSSLLAEFFDDRADRFIGKFSSGPENIRMDAKRARSACSSNKNACLFSKGMYHLYAEDWRKRFNETQLLIINGAEWMTDPGKLIERIQEFLGIPKLLRREDFIRSEQSGFYCLRRWWSEKYTQKVTRGTAVYHQGNSDLICLASSKGRTRNGVRSMYNSTYAKLQKFYEPHNRKLYKLLNEDFHW